MSLLDLSLHLGAEGAAVPTDSKQPSLSPPFPFPSLFLVLTPFSFFLSLFFPPNPIEGDGTELFALVITAWGCKFSFPDSEGAGTGSLAPHSSHLPPRCKSSR